MLRENKALLAKAVIFFVALIMGAYFLLSSRGGYGQSAEYPPYPMEYYNDTDYNGTTAGIAYTNIHFTQPDSLIRRQGVAAIAHVGTRRYYLPHECEAANTAFVNYIEGLIHNLQQITTLRYIPLRIFTTTDGRYDLSGRDITIDMDGINTLGWLTYLLTGCPREGHLPLWLAIGTEGYLRGLSFGSPADNINEFYFSPMMWGSSQQRSAVAKAIDFAAHLSATGSLEGLIIDFDEHRAAEYFYNFTGRQLDNSFRMEMPGFGYVLTATTEAGTYNFFFDAFTQYLPNLLDIVDYLDDAVRFTIGWYTGFVDFDAERVQANLFYRRNTQRGAVSRGRINIGWLMDYLPVYMPRQVSYMVESWVGYDVFAPFSSGLALAINIFHNVHDMDNHAFYLNTFWNNSEEFAVTMQDWFREIFGSEALGTAAWEYLHNSNDFAKAYHIGAYIRHYDRTSRAADPALVDTMGLLYTPHNAASFVLYLITTYGVDNYMQVHFDINSFEAVYGTTLEEMVERWLAFLDDLAAQLERAITP